MSADQIILLVVGLAVIAAVAATVAYATMLRVRGEGGSNPAEPAGAARTAGVGTARTGTQRAGATESWDAGQAGAAGVSRMGGSLVSPASTRQVARVVASLFLISVAVVVALTGAWAEDSAAIIAVVAVGFLLVVLFMDLMPASSLGRWRRPVEGVGAILFLGVLAALTGGAQSPFLVGFYLVVAGTALSTEGRAPLAVALVGSLTVAVVGLVDSVGNPPAPEELAWIGINAVALILLADIATAAARAQRHARDEAIRASRFDALTGLYNRSFFFTTMEQEIRRSDRMGRGFTMLMLDLDDLKPVNDTFGHQWGDRLLKAIADVIRHTIRFTDAAARYGGDEFVVLLPETDAAGGYVVAEKLRRDVAALTLHAADRNVRSSVSIGLVVYPDDGTTIDQLVAAADVAMYESKRRGKNRIVGYQTRTERVATAMDDETAELVQLAPASDVRTGGDPAPWSATEGSRGTTDYPVADAWPDVAARRRPDRAAIPVESGEPPAPWSNEPAATPRTSAPRQVPPDRSPSSGQGSSRDATSGEPPFVDGPPRDDPGRTRAMDSRPEPMPSEPPPGRSEPEPPPGPGRGRTEVGLVDRPWLTRLDGVLPRPGPQTAGETPPGQSPPNHIRPGGASPQRPAAEWRPTSFGSSRSDDLDATGKRPWIALPIEPDDPTDKPGS